jgi:hypothetical protein
MHDAILQTPPQPGWLRICPHCLRWFALRLLMEKADPVLGRVRRFRCASCGRETVFAERLPPGAI